MSEAKEDNAVDGVVGEGLGLDVVLELEELVLEDLGDYKLVKSLVLTVGLRFFLPGLNQGKRNE